MSTRQLPTAGFSSDCAHRQLSGSAWQTVQVGAQVTAFAPTAKRSDCATLDEWDALDAAVRDLEILRLAAAIAAQLEEYDRRWPSRAITNDDVQGKTATNELESVFCASVASTDVQANLSQNELESE